MNSSITSEPNENQIDIDLQYTSHSDSNLPLTTYTSVISNNTSLEDTKSTISEENSALKNRTNSLSSNDSPFIYQRTSDSFIDINNKISTLELEEEPIDQLQSKIEEKLNNDRDCYLDCDMIYCNVIQELSLHNSTKVIDKINNLKVFALNWFNLLKEKYNALNYYKEQDTYFINQLVIFLSFLFFDNMPKQHYTKSIEHYYTCFKYARLYWLHLIGKLIYNSNGNNCNSLTKMKDILKYNKIDIGSFTYEKLSFVFETLMTFICDSSRKLFVFLRKKNKAFKTFFNQTQLNEKTSFVHLFNKLQSNQTFLSKIETLNPKHNNLFQKNICCPILTNLNHLLPPKIINEKKYTLVLDLDETLVHFVENDKDNSAYVQIRKGSNEFINTLSKYFEIVIFTASIQEVSLISHIILCFSMLILL